MKLFYFLLLCNICVFASEKPSRQEMLRAASEKRLISNAPKPHAKLSAQNMCKYYCIGATAGVCFATTLCCGVIRYIENNKK